MTRPWQAMVLLAACGGDEFVPASPSTLPQAPSNLGSDVPSPARNPMTVAGVALGRRLFYDPLLSGDDGVACATCHQQALAFGDGVALGDAGVSGRPLLRHAPALQNLAWAEGLFWDGGAVDLESLAFAPLQHPDEQAQDVTALVGEVEAAEGYSAMFQAAFGPGEVSLPNLVRALAQFQRTLISANSRYDHHVRGEAGGDLSAEELAGLDAVRRHCSGCHASDHFTDFGYHNNGLDASYSDAHERLAWGRARISDDPADRGRYKTPSLRNVAVSGPYMHDGRFASLEAVIAHYRNGVVDSPSLAPRLRQAEGALGLPLDDEEAEAIRAFLEALTDARFLTDRSFGPP